VVIVWVDTHLDIDSVELANLVNLFGEMWWAYEILCANVQENWGDDFL
jgi:hypothetical protein